tara:strand:- start:2 stop:346 length:345 start_codon:yes stop_codon:yes gene_type:complete
MIDYLLVFPDKVTAIQFGVANGYTEVNESGDVFTNLTAQDYCLTVIGDHLVPTGETEPSPFGDLPIKESDGKHWVLFRDIKGSLEIPANAEQYISWRSDSGEDRPTDAPDRVFS